MSFPKSVQEVATRLLGKPFRKRRKLGKEEDAWCDAINELSVDSSSSESDEYHDVQDEEEEEKQPNPFTQIFRVGIKRKKPSKKSNKKKKLNDGHMSQHACSDRRKTAQQSGGFQFDRTHYSDSSIHHLDTTEPYQFGHVGGGSDRGPSSSSGVNNRSTSNDKRSQHPQNFVKSHTDTVKLVLSPRRRKITVTLMTSWQLFDIEGLKKKLQEFRQSRSDLIEEVRVLQLPYRQIHCYTFPEPVDVMILCHSIEKRGFAITNVTDSLYDDFLDYCNKQLGKERIAVIAHDIPPEEEKVRKTKMDKFKHAQWSTFEKTGLVMICGKIDKDPEIKELDWDSLVKFLEEASKFTPVKGVTSPPPPPGEKHTQPSSTTKPTKPETTNKKNGNSSLGMSFSGHERKTTGSRKPVIYVCTSSEFQSVKGLMQDLQVLSNRSDFGCEIREQQLPFSRLQDFKFPSEVDNMDAMVLCHSVENRGFSITDIPNAIYDDYLTYCNQLFGKNHVAVIVHDFEDPPEILNVHINNFRRGQPRTFKLANFIALAGKLDVLNVQLCNDGSQSLDTFVKELR